MAACTTMKATSPKPPWPKMARANALTTVFCSVGIGLSFQARNPIPRLRITSMPSCGTIWRARRSSIGWCARVPARTTPISPKIAPDAPTAGPPENRKLAVDAASAVST